MDYEPGQIGSWLRETGLFNVVQPGMTVVLKPNLIREHHLGNRRDWVQVITNGSVIRAVADVVCDRLAGRGKIRVAEGPGFGANIRKILSLIDLEGIRQECAKRGVELEFVDLRDFYARVVGDIVVWKRRLRGDPLGPVLFDLEGSNSEFYGHSGTGRVYYGADYDLAEVNDAHDGFHNLYSISKSVLDCDVFINLPKLKTHKKAGITCSLKNLVGINTYRNYLPHHTQGFPSEGGDQFPDRSTRAAMERSAVTWIKQHVLRHSVANYFFVPIKAVARLFFGDTSQVIRSGNWWGNDTIWRTVLDLNKIILYGRTDGSMSETPVREYISVVDGVVGGEGNGPMSPDPVDSNVLVAGANPVAVDCTCASIMGFDFERIPSLSQSFRVERFPIAPFKYEEIVIRSREQEWNGHLERIASALAQHWNPHFGWKGHIELGENPAENRRVVATSFD